MKFFVFENSDDIHKRRHYQSLPNAFANALQHPLGGILVVGENPPGIEFEKPFLTEVYGTSPLSRLEMDIKKLFGVTVLEDYEFIDG